MARRQPAPKLLTDYQRPSAASVAEHVDGDALVRLHESLNVLAQPNSMTVLPNFLAQPNWAMALENSLMALENLPENSLMALPNVL